MKMCFFNGKLNKVVIFLCKSYTFNFTCNKKFIKPLLKKVLKIKNKAIIVSWNKK